MCVSSVGCVLNESIVELIVMCFNSRREVCVRRLVGAGACRCVGCGGSKGVVSIGRLICVMRWPVYLRRPIRANWRSVAWGGSPSSSSGQNVNCAVGVSHGI